MQLAQALRGESGQAQILTVLTLGMLMTMAGLYTLEYVEVANRTSLRRGQITAMKTALEGAVQIVERIYHQDAACDPVILSDKLSLLAPDGSLLSFNDPPAVVPTARQIRVPVADEVYTVSIGSLSLMPLAGGGPDWVRGYSQDTVVELWTQRGTVRVAQRAVLINNCTYPCNAAAADPSLNICQVAWDAGHAYFPFNDGALDATQGVNPNLGMGTADVAQLVRLRNYLRSGETLGGVVPADFDANGDRKTDLMDLGILEKAMRGYLNRVPTRCGITSGCIGGLD